MIFHTFKRNMTIYEGLDLKLNEISIKRVKSFNFLGIILNEHLTWTDHIAHISHKINPAIALISRLKNQLPTNILKMIYNSLILSRLHYGNILWGRNPGSLIRLQKKAVRAVMGRVANAHSPAIFKKLKLISLPDLYNTKLLNVYKKRIDKTLPTYLVNMFQNMDLARQPKMPRTKTYEKTLRFELHSYLTTAPDYLLGLAHRLKFLSFKYNTKKYILERYSTLCTVTGCKVCLFTYSNA